MSSKIQTLQRQVDSGQDIKNQNENLKRKLYQFNEINNRLADY